MITIWFLVLSCMITVYAVLDGFDLGVGALLPFICKNESDRLQARESIGPVWNGNEVWLIAAGGAMLVAFPRLMAASFSGFYLALMLVLWMLLLRGIGFEFRHASNDPLWQGAWDIVFTGSSAGLAILFGVALGNVLRGVPLDSAGQFQGSFTLLLNPFALVSGLLSLAILSMHGAAFLAMKSTECLQDRARTYARYIWFTVLVLALVFIVLSFLERPTFVDNFIRYPMLVILPVTGICAMVTIPFAVSRKNDTLIFRATAVLIITLLASAAGGLYPRLLPSLNSSQYDLTIYNTHSDYHAMLLALVTNIIGLVFVIVYTSWIYRIWNGKVRGVTHNVSA